MNSIVDLRFRYSEQDYVRALRAHYAAHLCRPYDIVGALVMFCVGVVLWRSPNSQWFGLGAVVVSVVFAVILVFALVVLPPLIYRREPKLRDEYSFSFRPDGIHFKTASIDSRLLWSLYSRVLVDNHSYLLYYGSRQFTVVPKRAFQNAEQQRAFEELLNQHVSRIHKRGG